MRILQHTHFQFLACCFAALTCVSAAETVAPPVLPSATWSLGEGFVAEAPARDRAEELARRLPRRAARQCEERRLLPRQR